MLPKATFITSLAVCLGALIQLPPSSGQSIISISPNQIRDIGADVELTCSVKNPKKYTVLWIRHSLKDRKDITTLTANDKKLVTNSKFSVSCDATAENCKLTITDLTDSESGYYECQIPISADKKVTKTTLLQVRYAPVINPMPKEITVKAGEPFTLKCTADGFPQPNISWKIEDRRILPVGGLVYSQSVMNVAKAHRTHYGVYVCTAENGVDFEDTAKVKVNVIDKPIARTPVPKVGEKNGKPALLQCEVEAYPPPIISWYKANKEIRTEDFTKKPSPDNKYLGTYSIDKLSVKDTGTYTCKGQNTVDSARIQIVLYTTD